jgi:hypothetical protein
MFVIAKPKTHADIERMMMEKYGMAQPDENMPNIYKYGFVLETGSMADRSLARDCAEENGQVIEGVDIRYGLYCEHLK